MPFVYLDHAAGALIEPQVQRIVRMTMARYPANPSALYAPARNAKKLLEASRALVADVLHAQTPEIVFTASGTESNFLAIRGVCCACKIFGNHIITSAIEHASVMKTCKTLEQEGFSVTYLPVNQQGIIDPADLAKALRPTTVLVSIMYANNELGTIQPMKGIAKVIQKHRKKIRKPTPYWHTDACQATPYLDMNMERLRVDLLSMNASKIYGPAGVGCLAIRKHVPFSPVLFGGGQEGGCRPGTENLAGIVGFARALEFVEKDKVQHVPDRIRRLRDLLSKELKKVVPGMMFNGDFKERLPNNLHITVPGCDGEAMVLYLDKQGISVGTGSACHSGSIDPSPTLLAIGLSKKQALSSIRITLGRRTTGQDIRFFVRVFPNVLDLLRVKTRRGTASQNFFQRPQRRKKV